MPAKPISKPERRIDSTPATVTASASDAPRRRGRPPKLAQVQEGVSALISREQIVDRAIELAKVEPLAELSIVRLAREFGVTTGLIHYYIGSRDELISGVVNAYFKARVDRLASPTGDWRTDCEQHARNSYALMTEYGGVLRYVMSHNRFRLFQQVGPGQTDYGLLYLERVAQIFQDGGFSSEQTAMGYHLLAQFTMTAAYAHVSRQLPADHAKFIRSRIQKASAKDYPAAHFMAPAFGQVDAQSAFEAGLHMLLDSMEAWRQRKSATARGQK